MELTFSNRLKRCVKRLTWADCVEELGGYFPVVPWSNLSQVARYWGSSSCCVASCKQLKWTRKLWQMKSICPQLCCCVHLGQAWTPSRAFVRFFLATDLVSSWPSHWWTRWRNAGQFQTHRQLFQRWQLEGHPAPLARLYCRSCHRQNPFQSPQKRPATGPRFLCLRLPSNFGRQRRWAARLLDPPIHTTTEALEHKSAPPIQRRWTTERGILPFSFLGWTSRRQNESIPSTDVAIGRIVSLKYGHLVICLGVGSNLKGARCPQCNESAQMIYV